MCAQYDAWTDEVHRALKGYQRALDLKQHPAQDWPSVQALIKQGFDPITATRRVLDRACHKLAESHPTEADLLRQQYIQRRTPETIAADGGFDKTTFHRWRNQALCEFATAVAELNRAAKRYSARFAPRLPTVGFEKLIAHLTGYLSDPTAPAVVVIEGMGGLGKTTLAQHVADRIVADEKFAGVLWVSAQRTMFDPWSGQNSTVQEHASEISTVVWQFAAELGIDIAHDYTTLLDAVRARCKNAHYLLIIDNVETVQDMRALGVLVDLLAVPSRVLITTRERTADVLPASLPRLYVTLAELDLCTSLDLLRQAATHNHAWSLTHATDAELAQVYAIAGGNPLALWLIAGQARGLPWQVFIQELVLEGGCSGKPQALYDYLYRRSWLQLSIEARRVLFAVNRCEVGGDYTQVQVLSQLDRQIFHRAVEELTNRMLLQFDGALYSLHRLTQSFLSAVLVDPEAFDLSADFVQYIQQLATAQAEYMLQQATAMAPHVAISQAGGLIRDWVRTLNQPSRAIHFTHAFHPFVERWSSWGEWVGALDVVLELCQTGDTATDRIQILNYRSQAARELGDYAKARECAALALSLAEAADIVALTVTSLNKLGLAALVSDDLETAQTYLERGDLLGSGVVSPLEAGHILMNLGLVAVRRGEFAAAETYFSRALCHYHSGGDQIAMAKVRCSLVDLRSRLKQLREIPDELLQARDTFKQAGACYEYGLAENDVGCIALRLGDFDLAEQAFHTAIEVFEQLGTLPMKARVLSNLAELHVRRAAWDEAQVTLAEARQLAVACHKPLLVAVIDVDRGHFLAAQGQLVDAWQVWRQALAVQEAHGAVHAAEQTRKLLSGLHP